MSPRAMSPGRMSPAAGGRASPASSAVVDQAREMLEALRSKAARSSPGGRAAIERVARQVDNKLSAVEQRLSFEGERSPRMMGGQGSRPVSRGVSPSGRGAGGLSPRSPRSPRSGGAPKISWEDTSQGANFSMAGQVLQSILNEASPYLCVCIVTAMLVRSVTNNKACGKICKFLSRSAKSAGLAVRPGHTSQYLVRAVLLRHREGRLVPHPQLVFTSVSCAR